MDNQHHRSSNWGPSAASSAGSQGTQLSFTHPTQSDPAETVSPNSYEPVDTYSQPGPMTDQDGQTMLNFSALQSWLIHENLRHPSVDSGATAVPSDVEAQASFGDGTAIYQGNWPVGYAPANDPSGIRPADVSSQQVTAKYNPYPERSQWTVTNIGQDQFSEPFTTDLQGDATSHRGLFSQDGSSTISLPRDGEDHVLDLATAASTDCDDPNAKLPHAFEERLRQLANGPSPSLPRFDKSYEAFRARHRKLRNEVESYKDLTTSKIYFTDTDKWLLSEWSQGIDPIVDTDRVEVTKDPGGVTILRTKQRILTTISHGPGNGVENDRNSSSGTLPSADESILIYQPDAEGLWTHLSAAENLTNMPRGWEPVLQCKRDARPHRAATARALHDVSPSSTCLHPGAQRKPLADGLVPTCIPHHNMVTVRNLMRVRRSRGARKGSEVKAGKIYKRT
ncbi:hypothetical protein IAU59_003083 [Kwoniella sp. CBS 9459]